MHKQSVGGWRRKVSTPKLDGALWEAAQRWHECHWSSLCYIKRAAPVSPPEPEGLLKMTIAFGSYLFLKKPQHIILSMEDIPMVKEKCPVLVELT